MRPSLFQDYLEEKPGRARKEEDEDKTEEATNCRGKDKKKEQKQKSQKEVESAKKKRMDKKAWKSRRITYNPEIEKFIGKHAKEKLRWIEACCV